MEKLKVVFDCDDILWPLNKKMAKIAGINFDDLYTYSIKDNKNFSQEEKEKIIGIYGSTQLFTDINWYKGIEKINDINAEIIISTNCYTKDIANLKRKQLKEILNITDDKIHTHIINDEKEKDIDKDVYIFVDDSPYNIKESYAPFNILMKKPWNITKESNDLMIKQNVYKYDTLEEIIKAVNFLINKQNIKNIQSYI